MRFHIVRYNKGVFEGVVSGCGRHQGTLDSDHSKSAAYRHARALRQANPGIEFRVSPQFG